MGFIKNFIDALLVSLVVVTSIYLAASLGLWPLPVMFSYFNLAVLSFAILFFIDIESLRVG